MTVRNRPIPSHAGTRHLDQAKFSQLGPHRGRNTAVELGSVWIQIPRCIALWQIAPPLKRTPRDWLGGNKAGVKLDAAAQDTIGSPHLPQANDTLPRPDEPADHPIKGGLRPDPLPARRLPCDVEEILPGSNSLPLPIGQFLDGVAAYAKFHDMDGHATSLSTNRKKIDSAQVTSHRNTRLHIECARVFAYLPAMTKERTLHVVGAGLAGSEAAWQAAELGANVILHEMRPARLTEAHKTGNCAELVCSNSFRSDDWETNAVGLLHEEMRRAGSLIMQAADRHKLPAGGALAVDRDEFSAGVTAQLAAHPRIEIRQDEMRSLPPSDWASVIIATGPLTTPALSAAINALTGEDALAFFDAIAPIVLRDTIDMDVAWMQSRYDKPGPGGTGADYINCPMNREQYEAFINALLAAEKTHSKSGRSRRPTSRDACPSK